MRRERNKRPAETERTGLRPEAERLVGGLIARGRDPEPPTALLAGVMAGLTPKRASAWRRMRRWLTRPRTVTIRPLTLIPAAAVLLALVIGLSWSRFSPLQQAQPTRLAATAEGSIELTLAEPGAKQVAVIGDFNRWSPEGSHMHYDPERGVWTIHLRLPDGRHEYAFLVDGKEIVPDPKAVLSKDDGFGNVNSILVIGNGHVQDQII